ncbi:MAG: cell division protein SepF [Solirubrobacterales bacterium]|nr:cell division protein SepF [Solirubrobacterales bacterium]
MAIRDTWRRALEYFGLVEGDYMEAGEYTDEHDTVGGGRAPYRDDPESAPREAAPSSPSRSRRSSRRGDDIDDIFGDDEPSPRRRGRLQAVDTEEPPPSRRGNGGDLSIHTVTPRNFNDAQQVADEFKLSKPVILNLQSTDRELAKRLIDFCSGMTYALGGGMQRIAERVFLLTPQSVSVSADEKARILEQGFFNQS